MPNSPSSAITSRAKKGGETRRHAALKEAAFLWAQQQGMRAAGVEIGVPHCPYRADVAACEIGKGDAAGAVVRSAVFECKQSKADLTNDNRGLEETLERLEELRARRLKLERLLAGHFPHLRSGDSLFAEYETVEIGDLKHEGYRRTVKEIRALEKRVYGGTKFERMLRWRVANVFYLVIPRSLLEVAHVPDGWGILVAEDEVLEDGDSGEGEGEPGLAELDLFRRPAWIDASKGAGVELLHRIAVSGTWRRNREWGIGWEEVGGRR
jgi:hypothetical protein